MNRAKEVYKEVNSIITPLYLVGGCLRDSLLGNEPKDYDFATPLQPDDIESKIKGSTNKHGDKRKAYLTGKRFGTLGYKTDIGEYVEITTFRAETYSNNNRKPEVEFIKDITADLSRRDFTINAMAWRDGKLIDPHGGKVDLENKIIRAVGAAKTRIKEDPLRMLRAARFSSQLGFTVDKDFVECCKKLSYKILHVSKERWVAELDKLLMSDDTRKGLAFLAETRLLNYMIPALSLQVGYDQNSRYHDSQLWQHTINVVEDTPKENLELRWAALLHDVAKPFTRTDREDRSNYIHHDYLGADIAKSICSRLKFSNSRTEFICKNINEHLREDSELKEYDDKRKLK